MTNVASVLYAHVFSVEHLHVCVCSACTCTLYIHVHASQ